MVNPADWIALANLICLTVFGAFAFMRKSAFAPASVVEELRAEVADLRVRRQVLVTELAAATTEIASLNIQLRAAISDREWWRDGYQKLRTELDELRRRSGDDCG